MKLSATISAEIKIKNEESHDQTRERVLNELIKTIDEWFNGDVCPVITYSYDYEAEEVKDLKKPN